MKQIENEILKSEVVDIRLEFETHLRKFFANTTALSYFT